MRRRAADPNTGMPMNCADPNNMQSTMRVARPPGSVQTPPINGSAVYHKRHASKIAAGQRAHAATLKAAPFKLAAKGRKAGKAVAAVAASAPKVTGVKPRRAAQANVAGVVAGYVGKGDKSRAPKRAKRMSANAPFWNPL
jgi:hypothetical protein